MQEEGVVCYSQCQSHAQSIFLPSLISSCLKCTPCNSVVLFELSIYKILIPSYCLTTVYEFMTVARGFLLLLLGSFFTVGCGTIFTQIWSPPLSARVSSLVDLLVRFLYKCLQMTIEITDASVPWYDHLVDCTCLVFFWQYGSQAMYHGRRCTIQLPCSGILRGGWSILVLLLGKLQYHPK